MSYSDARHRWEWHLEMVVMEESIEEIKNILEHFRNPHRCVLMKDFREFQFYLNELILPMKTKMEKSRDQIEQDDQKQNAEKKDSSPLKSFLSKVNKKKNKENEKKFCPPPPSTPDNLPVPSAPPMDLPVPSIPSRCLQVPSAPPSTPDNLQVPSAPTMDQDDIAPPTDQSEFSIPPRCLQIPSAPPMDTPVRSANDDKNDKNQECEENNNCKKRFHA